MSEDRATRRMTRSDDRTLAGGPPYQDPSPADPAATVAGPAAEATLAGHPAPPAPEAPGSHSPGRKIGPYRLVKKIGEGGMGLVFEAEQFMPIRRKVALKMVRRGMATEEFIARFEAERQALAVMDHPCIARVLDAGATGEGQPFFVMEYVDGVPLTRYCDEKSLGLRDRLEIFVKICEGVQHAHQKAIIHRDLKPGNVLVTTVDGQPVPKIIDFGVAKVIDDKTATSTMTTGVGQLVGTPEYMSPEQADFDTTAVDTTTDVYALGVMLYELLVGQLPFTPEELKDKSFKEVLRTIKEVEPPRPSARLKTLAGDNPRAAGDLAATRAGGAEVLLRQLRGDLDWITMKALEKDKQRRYETANALAMDIRRHLDFEPVRACPPSRAYRMKKFARRNRVWVGASAFVLGAILLGIGGTTTGMIRAVRAERHAQQEAEAARQVSDFLVDLFEVADPDQARGNIITAREILDTGSARVAADLADQPLTQARLMNTIGKVYRNLGLYEDAGPKLESALDLLRNTGGASPLIMATSMADLADLYIAQARYGAAEDMLKQTLQIIGDEAAGSSLQLAQSLSDLASVYRRQGRYDEAEPLYERARDIRVANLGAADPLVASSYNSLAIMNWQRGNYDKAEQLYLKAHDIWRAAYGADHADVAKALNNLALLYHDQDRFNDALPLYREAADIYEKVLGPDHPRLGRAINNLALVNFGSGRVDAAEPLYLRALAIREKALGPDHPDVGQTLNNLANLYRDQGDHDRALPLYQRALAIREAALGPDHQDVGWSLCDLARLEQRQYDLAPALLHFEQALGIFTTALGPDHPDLKEVLVDYAEASRQANRSALADSLDHLARALGGKSDVN
jgi:serine/threonine protein kinase/tetratricopeptide (TPR) repeat protein